jgi:acetyl-CoA carboxylase biotin carboxylase subunit
VITATHYENAGTVEFVMSKEGQFYYLETNKRIQVEHLISEMVTGVDIVEKQLMMASEHRLDLSQDEIEFRGAAMNCRINAEDPARGFIPSPGRVDKFVPPGGLGVRVDSALYDGAFVPEYYDSLVAKVAVQGLHRAEVIGRMKVALSEMVVDGIKTTIPVYQTILEDRKFLQGNYHVQYLDKMLSGWKPQAKNTPDEIAAVFLAIRRTMIAPQTLERKTIDRRSCWRSSLEEPQLRKQALYVEGL